MEELILWQAFSDKALGGLMLAVALIVFTYYTAWALLLVRHYFVRIRALILNMNHFSLFFLSHIPFMNYFLIANGLFEYLLSF
jgi:hypothetical protein